MTDEQRILRRVQAWAGSSEAAEDWYRSQVLPGFELTPAALVADGRTEDVDRYLDRIAEGGFA
ncbi:antitoxin Xre/MbcA/ParS toxin-binding domain-containing protein [Roseivivax marinus]|uniref:antitoxin Xre/MbcA/ParS toxin-binding domain-containing protein n=1 Tax=Roseivivax marinus TaxID=1379903 RepID=UPI0009DCFADB|nr:antitoxin Xre/MbcA/ParS toxin-binding domain-containing protein [Roseivivax marinus]